MFRHCSSAHPDDLSLHTSVNTRQQRLNAIKQEMSEDKFGEIQHIYKTDFVREVSDASKDVWVVAYLYKE